MPTITRFDPIGEMVSIRVNAGVAETSEHGTRA